MYVHPLAVGGFDHAEHFHVLLEGQRDVDMIDALGSDDVVGVGEHAEEGEPAISDVIAGRAIVDEADDLEAELAMLEHLVGDHAPEISGTGNQHALEADPRFPPPLEGFANDFAREIGQRDVGQEEEDPHPL